MTVRRLAAADIQPASFAFNKANAAWANQAIRKYPKGRQHSAVIPLLMRAQEQEGWVTKAAIEHVADMIGMPYIRALEVATFYTQYQLHPVGQRAHIQVCGTTPCMLRGAEDLMKVCKQKIHTEQFHTNEAGTLSWEEVECLGACVNAPMVLIFNDTYEDLTPERLAEIIDAFETGKGDTVRPGPQSGRMSSEPASGLTSLIDEDAVLAAAHQNRRGQSPTEGVQVPPSRAAKPKTYAPETNRTLETPSGRKSRAKAEEMTSVPAPEQDPVQANKAAQAVEKSKKQRKHPIGEPGPKGAYKAPEKLHGEPIGEAGRRRKSQPAAEPGKPAPESPDEMRGAKPRKPGWVKKDGGK
jgi:NADH-quinone oxidoreductase subunit E